MVDGAALVDGTALVDTGVEATVLDIMLLLAITPAMAVKATTVKVTVALVTIAKAIPPIKASPAKVRKETSKSYVTPLANVPLSATVPCLPILPALPYLTMADTTAVAEVAGAGAEVAAEAIGKKEEKETLPTRLVKSIILLLFFAHYSSYNNI